MTLDEKMERQDASIKKMARALREGARMLDIACPVCNNPIFQYKSGEKVCVSCERKVIFEGEKLKKGNDNTNASVNDVEPQQAPMKKIQPVQIERPEKSVPDILHSLKEHCADKLALLVTKMEKTTDENELSVIYANVLRIIDILKHASFL